MERTLANVRSLIYPYRNFTQPSNFKNVDFTVAVASHFLPFCFSEKWLSQVIFCLLVRYNFPAQERSCPAVCVHFSWLLSFAIDSDGRLSLYLPPPFGDWNYPLWPLGSAGVLRFILVGSINPKHRHLSPFTSKHVVIQNLYNVWTQARIHWLDMWGFFGEYCNCFCNDYIISWSNINALTPSRLKGVCLEHA